jgi:hypothetical protein
MKADSLKRKLVAEIEKLPEAHLSKVLDLVEKLKVRKPLTKLKKRLNPAKNPLRGLIGIADVEPFAHKIDEELYGKNGDDFYGGGRYAMTNSCVTSCASLG